VADKQVFRVVIAGTQQAIFDQIASTDHPLGAIFNSRMHAKRLACGETMQMRTISGAHTLVEGRILEYDPPRRFAHTHRFTQHDDPPCTVTYELKPVAGGIEVTLTVDGAISGTKTAKSMASGGDFILRNLKGIVERGRPPFPTRLMYAMFGVLEFVLPARTKSDKWPMK
jgi:hypothetical protein